MHRYLRQAVVVAVAVLGGALPQRSDAGAGNFWRSLAVPGWGQHRVGQSATATRFVATEALLWLSYAGMQEVADIRARNYRTYAAAHAGAATRGKGGVYFDDLGFYASHQQHNQYAIADDGPQAQLYPNSPEFAWEWDSDASRERYRDLRNAAEHMERNALYTTGLIVLNHLVAAIHAGRAVPADAAADLRPQVGLQWQVLPDRVGVALQRRF